MVTQQEKIKITRMVGKAKDVIDNYLPDRTDTLKIACHICSVFLEAYAEEQRLKGDYLSDLGAMDAWQDRMEE